MGEQIHTKDELYNSANSSDSDFIGFTFNGIHSSTYNILRVSNGSRFSENLLPTFKDTTVERELANGEFFFSSRYNSREINVDIAFDSLTESNLRSLRQWLGDKQIHELIFDEIPYKAYRAKATGSPKIDFVCFEENGQRVYRGEGSIIFAVYNSFAVEPSEIKVTNGVSYRYYKRYLSDYNNTNKDQWSAGSNMLATAIDQSHTLDVLQVSNNIGTIDIFNAGDVEVPFKLYLPLNTTVGGSLISIQQIQLYQLNDTRTTETAVTGSVIQFNFDDLSVADDTSYLVLNGNNRLLEGMTEDAALDGNIYNKYITGGTFFLIPPGKYRLKISNCTSTSVAAIEYPYYYF